MNRVFAVYVAGSSHGDSHMRIASATAALRAADILVTSSWQESIAKIGDPNPRDVDHSKRRECSLQCLADVEAADCLWFIVPSSPEVTRGAWVEAGYAYAEGKHLVFSGDTRQSIFCSLGHEFEGDGAALKHITQLAARFVESKPIHSLFDLSDEHSTD